MICSPTSQKSCTWVYIFVFISHIVIEKKSCCPLIIWPPRLLSELRIVLCLESVVQAVEDNGRPDLPRSPHLSAEGLEADNALEKVDSLLREATILSQHYRTYIEDICHKLSW